MAPLAPRLSLTAGATKEGAPGDGEHEEAVAGRDQRCVVLSFAAVAGATTRRSTTTVGAQEPGSASVKCPKGQTAVAANVVGDAASPGPQVVVNTLARTGRRTVTTKAFNFGEAGKLTAIARCETGPKSGLTTATAPVPAATNTKWGEATATAQCPPGKRIVFGGFRAKRVADAPGYVFIEVTSATLG